MQCMFIILSFFSFVLFFFHCTKFAFCLLLYTTKLDQCNVKKRLDVDEKFPHATDSGYEIIDVNL